MEQKRVRGRPRNKLRVDPARLPELALRATGRAQLMAETGISQHDAEAIVRASKMTAEEFAERQRGRLQEIAEELAKGAKESLSDLSPMQKVIALGIVTDKMDKAPRALNQALHLHIKGDPGSALAAILGPAAQSVFRASGQPANMTEQVKIPSRPGPVIDAETTETS